MGQRPLRLGERRLQQHARVNRRPGLAASQSSYGGTSEIMKTIIARDLTGLRA